MFFRIKFQETYAWDMAVVDVTKNYSPIKVNIVIFYNTIET